MRAILSVGLHVGGTGYMGASIHIHGSREAVFPQRTNFIRQCLGIYHTPKAKNTRNPKKYT